MSKSGSETVCANGRRLPQDRALRLIAGSGAQARGWVLLSLFDQFDAMLQPLAVDEIGIAGEVTAAGRLMHMASGDLPRGGGPFLRLKAIEALGRLREARATNLLRDLLEAKKMWRWLYPSEIRISAFHALCSIASEDAEALRTHCGLAADDLVLNPLDSLSATFSDPPAALSPGPARRARLRDCLERTGLHRAGVTGTQPERRLGQRRTPHCTGNVGFAAPWLGPAADSCAGIHARRPRPGLGFEIAEMDLDERARLRRLLREQGSASISADQTLEDARATSPPLAAAR